MQGEDDSGSDDNMEYLGILPPAPPTSGVSVARQLLLKTRSSMLATRKPRSYSDVNDQALPCSEDLAKQKRKKKVGIRIHSMILVVVAVAVVAIHSLKKSVSRLEKRMLTFRSIKRVRIANVII